MGRWQGKLWGKGECFSGLAWLLDATRLEVDSQMLVVLEH